MTSRQSVCKAAQTAGDVSDWIAQMVEEDVEQDPDDEDITASEIATHPPAEETSETGAASSSGFKEQPHPTSDTFLESD